MAIYILSENNPTGPFSEDEIQSGLAEGKWNPEQYAWREGMEDWKPLKAIFPATPTLPPPPPISESEHPKALARLKRVRIYFAVFLIGFMIGAFSGVRKGCSSQRPNSAGSLTAPVQQSRTVTFGEKRGDYECVSLKKIESNMPEYASNRKHVEIHYQLYKVEIAQEEPRRLNLCPCEGDNIDIFVARVNPIYDQIIDLDLQYRTEVSVFGTVKSYTDSMERVYIIPDQVAFKVGCKSAECSKSSTSATAINNSGSTPKPTELIIRSPQIKKLKDEIHSFDIQITKLEDEKSTPAGDGFRKLSPNADSIDEQIKQLIKKRNEAFDALIDAMPMSDKLAEAGAIPAQSDDSGEIRPLKNIVLQKCGSVVFLNWSVPRLVHRYFNGMDWIGWSVNTQFKVPDMNYPGFEVEGLIVHGKLVAAFNSSPVLGESIWIPERR